MALRSSVVDEFVLWRLSFFTLAVNAVEYYVLVERVPVQSDWIDELLVESMRMCKLFENRHGSF